MMREHLIEQARFGINRMREALDTAERLYCIGLWQDEDAEATVRFLYQAQQWLHDLTRGLGYLLEAGIQNATHGDRLVKERALDERVFYSLARAYTLSLDGGEKGSTDGDASSHMPSVRPDPTR